MSPCKQAALLLLFSVPTAFKGQTAGTGTQTPPRPLQTELIAPLDLTHVHPGSPVYTHVTLQWADASCVLNTGSVVKGHVVALTRQSKSEKRSTLQVLFDTADCKNAAGSSPKFDIQALVGPFGGSFGNSQSGVSEGPPLSNDLPLTIGGGGGGVRNAYAASALTSNFSQPVRNLPPRILPGEVIDVPKTHLDTGAGVDGATIITSEHRDVRLETGTTFVLTPKVAITVADSRPSPLSAVPSAKRTPGGPASTPAPPPEPPDITDICSGTCNTVEHATLDSQSPNHAEASISLNRFGYPALSNRELAHFNQDTTVVYLGAGHLLCTFDPHHLRERTETAGEPARTVRAVLINTAGLAVERVFEWRVRGNGQYLWQLSNGHLLVHLGSELREFDTELHPLRSIHLEGRLAWVTASPAGDHIALGVIKERYSLAFRNELAEAFPQDLEEDIEVRLLDEHFQQLMIAVRSSRTPAPVLSDSGELRVQRQARDRWKITEIGWNRDEHLLAVSRSACRPTLSAPEHGLIFMIGCTTAGGRWYRMLHEDGHPVLKGDAPSNELELSAQAAPSNAFAVRTVEAVRALNATQPFRPSDLKQERIAVYSSATGARLSSLISEDFAPAEQGYALSPAADQIVLVGRDALHFYNVAHKP